ncbi:MAG: DUF4366 domain-containing protein [Lachnospiraceae bacterium]|nr:DUF4366 domain-containing protein [Lachnospiraceae bacterium]
MKQAKRKLLSCLLAVMLCVSALSVSAFAADITENETDTTDVATATGTVVNVNSCLNLRTGAGTEYEVIGQLLPGTEVEVIGQADGWYLVTVSGQTGYVYGDYLEVTGEVTEVEGLDDASLLMLLTLMFSGLDDALTSSDPSLTPEGNLTLVDDVLQTDSSEDGGSELEDKQFITVQSKSGNYFYIIIDRSGDTENVYFLNLVDEADLMALIDEEDTASADTVSCTCTDKCVVGDIDTTCPVCATSMNECEGPDVTANASTDADADADTTDTEDTADESSDNSGLLLFLLVALLAGGGAAYYFKIYKPKAETKGSADLDDYDYGEEDADEVEYEVEDADDDDEEDADL